MFDRYPALIIIPQKIRSKFEKQYNNLVEPFYCKYYEKLMPHKLSGINTHPRQKKIIVSLASYPARFSTLHLCLKSILNQTLKPDAIILNIDDYVSINEIPEEVQSLQKYGLTIKFVPHDLKPHKKYLFTMQEYPDAIIITIDDDVIYRRNLIKQLFLSYTKYPNAISAMRVHKMRKTEKNMIDKYTKWFFEFSHCTQPSFALCATGIGGILYPPHSLDTEVFNISQIKALCLKADDIWLKFMELRQKTPVVWVKSSHILPIEIKQQQNHGLNIENVLHDSNDRYIQILQNEYHINLADYC